MKVHYLSASSFDLWKNTIYINEEFKQIKAQYTHKEKDCAKASN